MKESRQPMRIAIVGAGAFGCKHADVISRIDSAKISAVVSDVPLDTDTRARFGGAPCVRFEDVLDDSAIDGVILCTPTPLHASQTQRCIEAAKPVLVEIPLADSLSDAERVFHLAQARGVTVMVGHTRRFNPSHDYLHRKFVAGDLKLQHLVVQTHFLRRQNLNALGQPRAWTDSLLWHHAAHTIDLFEYQAGEKIVAVNAMQGPVDRDLGIALDMSIQLQTRSGKLCTLSLSFNDDGPIGSFFRYICDNGTFEARYDDLFDGNGQAIADLVQLDGVELQDRAFISAIATGNPPNASINDVIRCYRILGTIEFDQSQLIANNLDNRLKSE